MTEARKLLVNYPAPVWEGTLGLRRAYARAIKHGLTVTESGADEKACGEIRALWNHVAKLLNSNGRSRSNG